MKIKVTLSLDIDADAWRTEYDIPAGAKALRNDVRTHVTHFVTDHLRDLDLFLPEDDD
jgi:hypothetical protein